MTTSEIIVTVAIIAIVVLLGFIAFCVWNHYRDVELSNYMFRKKLDNIDTNTATNVGIGIDLCTNPQMDCINCPKRDTYSTWSTSTNTIKED